MLTNSPKPVDYTTIMWNMKKKYLLDSVFIRYVPNIYPPKIIKNSKNIESLMEVFGLHIIMALDRKSVVITVVVHCTWGVQV